MSINLRLLVGSFIFALLTLVFAAFSYDSQLVSLDLARKLYEGGSAPLSRLEIAKEKTAEIQSRFSSAAGESIENDEDRLQGERAGEVMLAASSILSDIRQVLSADVSADLRRAVGALRYPLSRIEVSEGNLSRGAVRREFAALWLGLEGAVTVARADLTALRAQTSKEIERARTRNGIALVAVFCALFGFAMFLSRSIGGVLREMGRRARELASGAPTERIVPKGPREVREVNLALEEMGARCREIETTMMSEADMMAVRLNRQESQLGAALDNMTQALCMLDGQKRLVLCNQVFSRHFGEVAPGTPARAFLTDPSLILPLRENETATDLLEVGGAIMEVKRRGMSAKGLLITFEDITEKQRISRRLEHVAGHDGLTDLPNRKNFAEVLDGLLSKGRGLVVAVVDIRGFKSINDTHGHPVGDALLKECSNRLVRISGARATVSRLGGNEFAIALPGVRGTGDADLFAASLVASFQSPFDVEDRRIEARGSVGTVYIGTGQRLAGPSADIVLQNCDLALYQAKQEAGSAYRRFRPAMREKLQRRREMELDLQTALDEGQFELYYQPFVDTDRKRVSGFEALLRWQHPKRGMVSPSIFIPLAEETGLIERLGKWALETACNEAAKWPEDLTISVNLSAVQFKSPTLVDDVRGALAASGLQPRRLQIEVTESLFLDEGDRVLSILKEFRRLGLTISMDDFGTGYSSLGYLSRFPFDKIKIDQSFVRDMARAENIAIVRSIIGLSRALNMSVIAEGIETPEQMQILYGEGCREMQGYFFSKPRPSSDLAKILMEVANQWGNDRPSLRAEKSVVAA
ncbi:MAG TPA: EAL domain-containing protein [Aurantimonas sp.]